MFKHPGDSHRHSLETLNALYEHDDFMASIATLVDLGCGAGEDLEWWATRTTRDDDPQPLNIKCQGIDILDRCPVAHKYDNVSYQKADFEKTIVAPEQGYDVFWSHDSFQYATNPLATLAHWNSLASPGAMLVLILPITNLVYQRHIAHYLPNLVFYHYTMVSLMYMLATTGWDCRSGFFLQRPQDPWLQAIVYKSDIAPMDPKATTWFKLRDLKLLPESADDSIYRHGYVRQHDLLVPWLDKSLISMAKI